MSLLQELTKEVSEKEASGPVYSAANPGESPKKHIPDVSFANDMVTIQVHHGKRRQ